MYRVPIYGKVTEIEGSVRNDYEDFWRIALSLIKDGVLTYQDINVIDEDELYTMFYANKMFNEELRSEIKREAGED